MATTNLWEERSRHRRYTMSFSPAGNQQSNLPQSTVKFYDKL
jgi:hypothetical protein